MLRNDSFSGEKLDGEVVRFFDKHKDFQAISELFNGRFTYFSESYDIENSDQYFKGLANLIKEVQQHSKVLVFLDPDTGVEPEKSTPGSKHLRKRDICLVCKQLRVGEKLVVYQHASRMENWQNIWTKRLEPWADEMGTTLSEPYYEEKTAKDVCFFIFTKK
jgi:hypothetical protein